MLPFLSHRLREHQVLAAAMLLTAGVFCVYPLMHNAWLMGLCAAALGLALGAVAALFPPIGIGAALLVGGLGGATLGSIVGHYETGLGRGELKELGDALENGEAGLVVVYAANYAEQVGKLIKTENKYISQMTDAAADEITAEIKAAEGQK